MENPEEPGAAEASAAVAGKDETAEAVVEDVVETAEVQEAVPEVAQEMAEVVTGEEAAPLGSVSDQQGVVELADDLMDPVDDLPLDDELLEMLPTVVEDPENEAKEQKELLEESIEEATESVIQAQPTADDTEHQIEDIEGPSTEADIAELPGGKEAELEEVITEKISEQADGDAAAEVTDSATAADPSHKNEQNEEDADQANTAPVPETSEATADLETASETPETAEKPSENVQAREQPADAAEEVAEVAEQSQTEPGDETQQQVTEEPEPTSSPQTTDTLEGDSQVSKPSSEEVAGETNEEETKEKKKRKKSKEERKKKKSVEEKEPAQEKASSKPALLHVRGGFSCGWVGPMLQLLGTMKKLDEFKECHGKRYTPRGSEHGQRPEETPEPAPEPEEEASAFPAPEIPEAAIRAPPGEGCPRCGGAVFEAERMKSRFRSYHKPCFNCKACHRILDSTLACDGPDKDVYCKLCYAKKYGPKGYGFGGGKAFLQCDIITAESPQSKPEWVKLDRTTIKPTEGSGCPRCGGAVFAAELMMSKGQEWHTSCFSCRDCKRPLDSTIACDGPDREIYCKLDYAKRFGPKGFGFGHTLVSFVAGDEQDQSEEGVQHTGQPSMGPKAAPGEGCPRCDFAVYAAEMMLHNGKAYHRHCFRCCECGRCLDSTNTCSGPQQELLCRTCYGKLHGPHGVGYGQGAGVLSMG